MQLASASVLFMPTVIQVNRSNRGINIKTQHTSLLDKKERHFRNTTVKEYTNSAFNNKL